MTRKRKIIGKAYPTTESKKQMNCWHGAYHYDCHNGWICSFCGLNRHDCGGDCLY